MAPLALDFGVAASQRIFRFVVIESRRRFPIFFGMAVIAIGFLLPAVFIEMTLSARCGQPQSRVGTLGQKLESL